MTQEELLKRYHEKNIEEEISFTKAYRYYKTARKFYEDLPGGLIVAISLGERTTSLKTPWSLTKNVNH